MASPIHARDLPPTHLRRLILRECYIDEDSDSDSEGGGGRWLYDDKRFVDLRRPVDWAAVSARLATPVGRHEARQWVQTGRSGGQLLLHALCEFNFVDPEPGPPAGAVDGQPRKPILPIDGDTAVKVLRQAIEAYPEALKQPDAEGYFPLHRVCQRRLRLGGGALSSLEWGPAVWKVFDVIYRANPDAMFHVTSFGDETLLVATPLHCALEPTAGRDASGAWERILGDLLTAFPGALGLQDDEGRLPLHLACYSHPPRALMHHMIVMHPSSVGIKCKGGDLPLHIFLESCMGQRARAIQKGYARGEDDYHEAVAQCFRMLLETYPEAAGLRNGTGRFPLHLALDTCRRLPYDRVIRPLLHWAPRPLVARDVKNGLYPFMAAAVGECANLDVCYSLLRLEPSMVQFAM